MRRVCELVLVLGLIGLCQMAVSCAQEQNDSDKVIRVEDKAAESKISIRQTTDALSGNPINRTVYVDHKGKRIYFCCANSKKDFLADPEAYLKVFRSQGVTLDDAPSEGGSR